MPSVEDRVALLLSIKEMGRTVKLDHIHEKVSRDTSWAENRRVTGEEVRKALTHLIREGYAEEVSGEFRGTDRLDSYLWSLLRSSDAGLNRSYLLAWLAKTYYPKVADRMMPFLQGRPVSAVKVFSGKTNPVEEIQAIFVRYSKHKPRPVLLTIDTEERLLSLVHDHCVDFIPYVHPLNSQEPDVFVLDLDAGRALLTLPKAFDFLKFVTHELAELLTDLGIDPLIKFSGSRGFQLWARLDNQAFGKGELFRAYRELAVSLQQLLEHRLQSKTAEVRRLFPAVADHTDQFTTAQVAGKEERAYQILVDWSSMKPMGDARSPYSIHYKTGLVSLPLRPEQITTFQPVQAHPLEVLHRLSTHTGFTLKLSRPTKLPKMQS